MIVPDTTYTTINGREFPPVMRDLRQWMVTRSEDAKHPFAPWTDPNAPAPCNADGCSADTAAECDHDARYKWGWDGNYREYEKVELVRTVNDTGWEIEYPVFIVQDTDPFVFIDFDDVVTADGDVHPAVEALLTILGKTYVALSGSGEGVHAFYRGSLPVGVATASWTLDDEPWVGDDTPSVEVYDRAHVARVTGSRVEGYPNEVREWDGDVVAAVLEATGNAPADAREERVRETIDDVPGIGEDDEADEWEDVFDALDTLDARRVAEETIVSSWNDEASTSEGERAFHPTWGGAFGNGTANIVNEDTWLDTGDVGGSGGVVEMAAIDAGIVSERHARPGAVSGYDWVRAYKHLQELGFDVPELPDGDDDTDDGYTEAVLREHAADDLGDVSESADAALVAAVRARDDGAVEEDATPGRRVLRPLVEYLTGLPANHDAVTDASWTAAESAYHVVGEDDLRDRGVIEQ